MTILAMLPGLEERVITVVTPAEVARRAATILVDMPPVPRAEPALDTGFVSRVSGEGEREAYHLLPALKCLLPLQWPWRLGESVGSCRINSLHLS